MLEMINVSKKFNQLEVLKNFSCKLHRGDFVIIMGPNGTGKSTLFETIGGKVTPDEGTILLDGVEITHIHERKRSRWIGRLHQNTYLGSCSNLTIRENLAMVHLKDRRAGFKKGLRLFPEMVVDRLLRPLNLNLEKMLDVPMGAISGGQRQIIAFIMTIINPPKILLLDEPTAALDPASSMMLLSFARDYANEHQIPTLLITHDPLIAKHLGNHLWILQNGRIHRKYGMEKQTMSPSDLFQAIDYVQLGRG